MDTKANDFKLGVFVLIGFGILCAGLFGFGAASYFQRTTVEETYVAGNVDGLVVGAPVSLRGVRVGQVTRIDFSWNIYQQTEPRYVVIEFEVRNNISPITSEKTVVAVAQAAVKNGLRARVKAQGFTGACLLSLEYVDPAEFPPAPVPWTPRHIYIPSAPSELGELLASLGKTLHNLDQLDIHKLGGLLDRDLDAAGKLLGHLDEVNFRGLVTNADALITDARGASANVNALVADLRGEVKELHLGKVSGDADELIVDAKGTIHQLDLVIGNLDTVSLNAALANIRLSSKDLDETLRKLKEYPAGFLFGAPPPSVKSLEKPK